MVPSSSKGAFTLTETKTDKKTKTRTNKGTEPIKWVWNPLTSDTVSVLVQYEHLHTIPYDPFYIGLVSVSSQCEHTLKRPVE